MLLALLSHTFNYLNYNRQNSLTMLLDDLYLESFDAIGIVHANFKAYGLQASLCSIASSATTLTAKMANVLEYHRLFPGLETTASVEHNLP